MPDRVALYLVTHEDFISIIQSCDGRTPIRVQGLPDSPELLDFWASGLHHGGIFLKVRSPDHEEVADGEIPVESGLLFVSRRETSPGLPQAVENARQWLEAGGVDDAGEALEPWGIIRNLRDAAESILLERDQLRQEVEQLRAVFSDYRQDNDGTDLSYQQGWREAQAQRDLKDGRERARRKVTVEDFQDIAGRQISDRIMQGIDEAAQPHAFSPTGMSTGAGEDMGSINEVQRQIQRRARRVVVETEVGEPVRVNGVPLSPDVVTTSEAEET